MARSRLSAWLVTLPPFAWIALFLFTPYCLLFCYSFWSLDAGQQVLRHATLTNYLHLATTPLYLTVILRSMRIAFSVVVLSLLIGYPLACFLVFQAGKYRRMLYQAVIIPLWISYLVRAYAWKVIFGNEGVMNTLLLWCHATRHPLGFLLYSPFAVIVTLTHIYVPFVVLPVVASLEKIPHELLESSSDLGATAWQTFTRVILPLSLPGVLSGATFAFLLSFGDFLSPLLLGGPSSVMIANIVANLFGADYNWPLGAAVAVLILVMVLVILTDHAKAGTPVEGGMKRIAIAYAGAAYAFLYLPIVVLVVYSFNRDGVGGFPPQHWTLDWYRTLFDDSAMWTSVGNSAIVALSTVVLSMLIGFPAAYALDRYSFPGKAAFQRLVLLPLIVPGVITGISLLLLTVSSGFHLSLVTVILGHSTALTAVATTEIFAGLAKLDRALEEASADLGASRLQTLVRIVLPGLQTSLLGTALLVFTLSMDEIAVTFFLIGRENTLPLEIWSRLRRGATPEMNAIATLIFLFSVITIFLSQWLMTREVTNR